ncbi:MAG: galactose-1-phosphate uridylyltransferase [Cyanobacteria bacterium NC_groundwater_1444_Ag_S-0.65um_54_12]|nr:galactose-1-phosphate uridylyltransferase [Cyanobacteria bacterium NC_groundwater_1444_Ag_S-0.65um_54_12]
MSELRWHPILEEWVVTATHRQDRTFLPPADYCPLCPTLPGGIPTEIPTSDYQFVVLENKFPSFQRVPPPPAVTGDELYKVMPAEGICEVILYSPDHNSALADRPVTDFVRLIRVWTERYRELANNPQIAYVFIFENRGEAIGVTLTHPHGQIYAFPFIPPKIQRELDAALHYHERTGACLFCAIVRKEQIAASRIVAEGSSWLACVPFFARYPYETHLLSKIHRESLLDLTPIEVRDLAWLLKVTLSKFDRLWQVPLPFMMVMHQAPTDGLKRPGVHLHIEFYPPMRTRDKLKYLAGCESGAGTFINDALPEEKAAELRAIPV